jgi:hypothetical protein
MLDRKSNVFQKSTKKFQNNRMQQLIPEFISSFEEPSENQQAVWNLLNKYSFTVQYGPFI